MLLLTGHFLCLLRQAGGSGAPWDELRAAQGPERDSPGWAVGSLGHPEAAPKWGSAGNTGPLRG